MREKEREEKKGDDEVKGGQVGGVGEVAEEQKKNAGTARVSNRICLICFARRLRQPASKRIYQNNFYESNFKFRRTKLLYCHAVSGSLLSGPPWRWRRQRFVLFAPRHFHDPTPPPPTTCHPLERNNLNNFPPNSLPSDEERASEPFPQVGFCNDNCRKIFPLSPSFSLFFSFSLCYLNSVL